MNFRTTGILLAVLLALGVVYMFTRGGSTTAPPPGGPGPTPAARFVFDSPPTVDKIVKVELRRPDQPTLAFERLGATLQPAPGEEGAKWQMRAPVDARSENWRVNDLVMGVATLRSRAHFDPGQAGAPAPADAGLAPPRATIVLTDAAAHTWTLEIGRTVTLGNDTYVRVAGEQTIHVAQREWASYLATDIADYRDRTILPVSVRDVSGFELKSAAGTTALHRTPADQWELTAPVAGPADAPEAVTLLGNVVGLRAVRFVDSTTSAPDFGFDAPFLSVKLDLRSTDPNNPAPLERTLVVGGAADLEKRERYARLAGEPWVCVLAGSDVDKLKPNLAKLHDLHLVRLRPEDIAGITVARRDETYSLERRADHWTGGGALGAVDEPTAASTVAALSELRAVDLYPDPNDLTPYGLAQPAVTVTVRAADPNRPPRVIRFGIAPVTGVNAYAQLADQPAVYVIGGATVSKVAPTALTLAARDLLHFDASQVERFARRDAQGTLEVTRESVGWHCVNPPGRLLSGPAIDSLLRDLSGLRAARVVARGGAAQYDLDQPTLTLQLLLKPDADAPATPVIGPPPPEPAAAPPTAPASAPTAVSADQTATAPASSPSAGATSAPTTASDGVAWTHTLRVSLKEEVAYCQVDDNPFVFELDRTVYTSLSADLSPTPE